jgi:hypothetical protein
MLFVEASGQAKVGKFNVPLLVYEDIVRFDIADSLCLSEKITTDIRRN